jgi:hypothetical protein
LSFGAGTEIRSQLRERAEALREQLDRLLFDDKDSLSSAIGEGELLWPQIGGKDVTPRSEEVGQEAGRELVNEVENDILIALDDGPKNGREIHQYADSYCYETIRKYLPDLKRRRLVGRTPDDKKYLRTGKGYVRSSGNLPA